VDARWMPILAASVGVLGGLGGALVGGFLTNRGQAEEFKRERAAAKQELRREAYADYLGTAEGFVVSFAVEPETTAGDRALEAQRRALFVQLFVSRARVFLAFENDAVLKAAEAISDEITSKPTAEEKEACADEEIAETEVSESGACVDNDAVEDYRAAANEFLRLARVELAEAAE
jgi:hypothetical protein